MRLERFEGCLENGRKVVWYSIDPYLNIIVGDNGVGKTLLLREVNDCVGEFRSIYVTSCAGYGFDKNQSIGQRCYASLLESVRFAMGQDYDAILIDDIELYLSVKKQIGLISEMRSIAPDLQFFISTHSPYIYQDWSAQVVDVESLLAND